ncbi:MAG TPA: hypothetical protein VLU47_18500 [Blastocatellia bacterium]|nr:hypothetical protein [Blastocatellia bacterium]
MQKELTINVDERVYDELQRIGGPEDISQFIESLILPRCAAWTSTPLISKWPETRLAKPRRLNGPRQ